jgi:hypothetical protein
MDGSSALLTQAWATVVIGGGGEGRREGRREVCAVLQIGGATFVSGKGKRS